MRPIPLLLTLLSLVLSPDWSERLGAQTLTTKRIASGLNRPVWAGAPAGDDRIFIVERRGVIKVLENGILKGTNFLNIVPAVGSLGSEQGLLGMAFHPDYANNGFFFLNYTNGSGNTVVSRWSVSATNSNQADAASEVQVLTQIQPFSNHNAGVLMFGLDGYLYIPFGDGGGANDPSCRAQNPLDWLGKMLRIDVDSLPYSIPPTNPFVGNPSFLPEIYHLGLRNPFRASVDRMTGDLFIGDVGQDQREEICFAPAGVGALNFGWKTFEGTRCNSTAGCTPGTPACASGVYSAPIRELVHLASGGPKAIIGGYVYRGCAIPGLQGTYFFADYSDNLIRSFRYDVSSGSVNDFTDRTAELAPGGGLSIASIASFGEDGFGELLIVKHRNTPNGEVYKIVESSSSLAASAVRNGSGVNATCYSSQSKPILGNLLRARVNTLDHPGASMATILGYSASQSGLFFNGNEILVDLASAFLFSISSPVSGGVALFQSLLPCDPAIQGITIATQAFSWGAPPVRLCNAIDMTAGGY